MKLYKMYQEMQEHGCETPEELYKLCEESKITAEAMLVKRWHYRTKLFRESSKNLAGVIKRNSYMLNEIEEALAYFFYEPSEHLFAFELIQLLKRDFEVSKYDDLEDYLAYVIGGLQGRSGMLLLEMGGIENCHLLN